MALRVSAIYYVSFPDEESAASAVRHCEGLPVAITRMPDTDRELRLELVAPDGDEQAAFAELDQIVEQIGGEADRWQVSRLERVTHPSEESR
jgi:hypothetical protein